MTKGGPVNAYFCTVFIMRNIHFYMPKHLQYLWLETFEENVFKVTQMLKMCSNVCRLPTRRRQIRCVAAALLLFFWFSGGRGLTAIFLHAISIAAQMQI